MMIDIKNDNTAFLEFNKFLMSNDEVNEYIIQQAFLFICLEYKPNSLKFKYQINAISSDDFDYKLSDKNEGISLEEFDEYSHYESVKTLRTSYAVTTRIIKEALDENPFSRLVIKDLTNKKHL